MILHTLFKLQTSSTNSKSVIGRKKVSQEWYCLRKRFLNFPACPKGLPNYSLLQQWRETLQKLKLQKTSINTYYRDSTYNADIQESSKTVVVGVCGEVHPALGEILLEITFGHITVKKKLKAFDTLHSKVGVRVRIVLIM